MTMKLEAVPVNAIGSMVLVVLDHALMQRGVEIELVLPILASDLEAAVSWAISVVIGLWRAARDVKALQALALGATLKVVGSIHRAVYRASRGHLGGTFQGG